MKFVVFVFLSCLAVCFASVKVTNWGNVNARTMGTENVLVSSSFMQVKTHTFTYPKVSWFFWFYKISFLYWNHFSEVKRENIENFVSFCYILLLTIFVTLSKKPFIKMLNFLFFQGQSAYAIYGIKHMDYKSHPVSVRFLKGDIGSRNITIQIESQRNHGINSTFIFYTLWIQLKFIEPKVGWKKKWKNKWMYRTKSILNCIYLD